MENDIQLQKGRTKQGNKRDSWELYNKKKPDAFTHRIKTDGKR